MGLFLDEDGRGGRWKGWLFFQAEASLHSAGIAFLIGSINFFCLTRKGKHTQGETRPRVNEQGGGFVKRNNVNLGVLQILASIKILGLRNLFY